VLVDGFCVIRMATGISPVLAWEEKNDDSRRGGTRSYGSIINTDDDHPTSLYDSSRRKLCDTRADDEDDVTSIKPLRTPAQHMVIHESDHE
jgi:hypothetical protein